MTRSDFCPALSVILPANNEAAHIDGCLAALLASTPLEAGQSVQVIVAANGCSDDTAQRACAHAQEAAAKGWELKVLDLPQGGKTAALTAADAAAKGDIRVYLDADVIVTPNLLAQTHRILGGTEAAYASGTVRIPKADTWVTRCYAGFYQRTPFMKQIAPGCGYFAMNGKGRARWAEWPQIISDDTFARLQFAPEERHQVRASYLWPLVEGMRNLVRVRRRQNAGVAEIADLFPELLRNDAKTEFSLSDVLTAALAHPLGFAVYAAVSGIVKLTPAGRDTWSRGR